MRRKIFEGGEIMSNETPCMSKLTPEAIADARAYFEAKPGSTSIRRDNAYATAIAALEAIAKAKAENERLTEIAEQHEVELAFWKPGLAAWRMVTAPTDADLEALLDVDGIRGDRNVGRAVLRKILAAIADRARAPEREGDEK